MANGERSKLESGTPGNGFQATEIAHFLRSKKLAPLSLILLDMIIPFKRQAAALISVAGPFSSIVLGEERSEKILDFSRGEGSFEALKEALERGEE